MKSERKSVKIRRGRAAVTGYKTSTATLSIVEGEGEEVGMIPESQKTFLFILVKALSHERRIRV